MGVVLRIALDAVALSARSGRVENCRRISPHDEGVIRRVGQVGRHGCILAQVLAAEECKRQ